MDFLFWNSKQNPQHSRVSVLVQILQVTHPVHNNAKHDIPICLCLRTHVTEPHKQAIGNRIFEHIPAWLATKRNEIGRTAITKHLGETGHKVKIDESFEVIFEPKHKHLLNIAKPWTIRRIWSI